jgi:predicted DNA-binding transcriptional regulator AlpA
MTTPPNPADPFDRLIRKREILQDLGVNASTLWLWIKRSHFPRPVVLNPGVGNREIVAWPESVYRAWKAGVAAKVGAPDHGQRVCTASQVRPRPQIIESTFDRVRYGFTTIFPYHILWW